MVCGTPGPITSSSNPFKNWQPESQLIFRTKRTRKKVEEKKQTTKAMYNGNMQLWGKFYQRQIKCSFWLLLTCGPPMSLHFSPFVHNVHQRVGKQWQPLKRERNFPKYVHSNCCRQCAHSRCRIVLFGTGTMLSLLC